MARYIHEQPDWPKFRWNAAALEAVLADVRYRQGLLLGKMEALGFDAQRETGLEALSSTIVQSSAIEGESLDYGQVRSSVARSLGIEDAAIPPSDRYIEGIVEITIDATENYSAPLTKERLFGWHAALFPTGYSGLRKIDVAKWRSEDSDPMQVVSGSGARERVHFEAPPARALPEEAEAFLSWFDSPRDGDPLLRAGIAHLYFVTLHPFSDGNGRIARVIADMGLARAENRARRFYSLSSSIKRERSAYYSVLEAAQRGTMDVTHWLGWFVACVGKAIDAAEETLKLVMQKSSVWNAANERGINARQRVVLTRLLAGFEGKLTSARYAKLAKCSQDTALRDIDELIRFGILERGDAGGRSTSYRLAHALKTGI